MDEKCAHLDDRNKKPFLVLLMHCTTDGANGPAQLYIKIVGE